MLLRPSLPHYFFCVYLLFQNVAFADDYSTSLITSPTTVNQEIISILNTKQNLLLTRADFEYRAEDVDALYKTTTKSPILSLWEWVNRS